MKKNIAVTNSNNNNKNPILYKRSEFENDDLNSKTILDNYIINDTITFNPSFFSNSFEIFISVLLHFKLVVIIIF